MIRSSVPPPTVVMGAEVTDPGELARAAIRRAKFLRNMEWFEAHALEIGRAHRGRFVCVAGQELFVADSPQEAYRAAHAAHPDEVGSGFLVRVPNASGPKVYAVRR